MNELSLFSGYGGLSLALKLTGIQTRTVAYVEWEKYPQEIIKARIKDGFLNDAPIFGDISTFRGEQFRGVVDIITAGFPCPPFSVAGKQRGSDDTRNKWPDTLRVIREVRPQYVLLENVPGILTASRKRGTPSYGAVVVGELAETGYDCFWQVIGADDIGAPHRRKRWLCFGVLVNPSSGRYRQSEEEIRTGGNTPEYADWNLADSKGSGHRGGLGSERGDGEWIVQSQEQGWSEVGSEAKRRNRDLADPTNHGREHETRGEYGQSLQTTETRATGITGSGDIKAMADSSIEGLQGGIGNHSREERQTSTPVEHDWARVRSQIGRGDGAMADTDSSRGEQNRQSPQLWSTGTEQSSGDSWSATEGEDVQVQTRGWEIYPTWPPSPTDTEQWTRLLAERPDLAPAITKEAECEFCFLVDGRTYRVDQLKALGNGVVPSVVSAFLSLLRKGV